MSKLVFALVIVFVVGVNGLTTFSASPRSQRIFRGEDKASWAPSDLASPSQGVVSIIFAVKQNVRDIRRELEQVSDPMSPRYTDYRTLDQLKEFVDRDATRTVVSWLVENNVHYDSTINGEYIIVVTSVRKAESLLQAEFKGFTSKVTGKTIFRTASYALPDAVANAVDFVERTVEFPLDIRPSFSVVQAQTNASGDVVPSVLWKYYNVESAISSAAPGNVQSVFEALGQSYSPTDLSTFEKDYSVATDPISKVIGPNSPLGCLLNPNNCAEASLDVEYILAIAQNVPTVFWSIASSDQTPFVDWAIAVANDTNPPLVHSMSYGGVESTEPEATADRFNTEMMKLGVRGVSVFIASGDDGVANFPARSDPTKCGFVPSFPATSPYVTAVGATMGPESGKPEVACTSDNGGLITTGGGFSGYFKQPSYQTAAVAAYMKSGVKMPPSGMYNGTGRGYPDVAMMGHNYEILVNGQKFVGSGTSASTPVFAGVVSLVNDARLKAGKKSLGFLNPALYKAPTSIFHDITSGENNCAAGPNPDCCEYGFFAAKGWDPVTGLGSVDFAKFKAHFASL